MPGSNYNSTTPPRNCINPTAAQLPTRLIGLTDPDPRFVLHVPFHARTLGTALEMAALLADFLSFIPDVDQGETTVTHEDDQTNHHRVICDQRLPDGTRCPLHHGHLTPCTIGNE
ncbi:hypothetical protein GCM10027290_56980 [Micromonospora sonneratiae]